MTAPTIPSDVGTFPATGEGIRAALRALGGTPARVAATLDRSGYTGEPGESTRCPVAAYLLATLDPGPLRPASPVAVGDTTVTVFLANGAPYEIDLPEPVRRFVDAFDTGLYTVLRSAGYTDPEQDDVDA